LKTVNAKANSPVAVIETIYPEKEFTTTPPMPQNTIIDH
jgi:hypothetical protein